MMNDLNRRDFLLRSCSSLTGIWISSNWPSLLSAATHARQAVQAPEATKLSFFTPAQATEIDAICARIIPTTETPGAREAGVVYFIDRALTTFAVDQQKDYREGLPEFEARVHEMFPTVERFSSATPEQQDEILHSFDDPDAKPSRRPYRPRKGANNFFETVRMHTIVAFFSIRMPAAIRRVWAGPSLGASANTCFTRRSASTTKITRVGGRSVRRRVRGNHDARHAEVQDIG